MAKKTTFTGEQLAPYDALIASVKGVERKGAAMPYTSLNGHMFSFIDASGTLSLRLPKDELENFFKKYKTGHSVQHGAVMKEYALVPAALYHKPTELKTYFKISADYVQTLKPKSVKK